jgi:hypothetical protein
MKQFLLVGTGLLLSFAGFAQKARAFWENDTVLVGEHAILKIIVTDVPEQMKWSKIVSATNIEIRHTGEELYKKEGEIEVFHLSKDYNKKNRSFTILADIIAWDTANYQLPELSFELYSKDWKTKDSTLSAKAPELAVVFKKKHVDTSITEIPLVEVNDPWRWLKDYWWIIALVLAIPTGFYLWNKRNKTTFSDRETLKKSTLKRLEALRGKKLWLKGDVEKHYVEYSHILRSFLSERYSHNFLGKTSFETQVSLKVFGVEQQVIDRIKKLLLESDFTKFGKSQPGEEQIITSMNKLEELIVELSPLDIPANEHV